MGHVRRMVRPAADVLATTKALCASGKAVIHRPDYVTADLSGPCSADLIVEQMGHGHLTIGTKSEEKWESARTLSLKVPCRQCGPCRKARRMLWTDRAVREYRASTRSWFVTLTFRPEERYKLRLQAIKRLRDSGGSFERLAERDQYAELLREYQRPVALYLMRLRKGLAKRGWALTSFRYLLVPERHEDGAPHFHVLLHEVDELKPLRKARIEQAWPHGVIHARLLRDERAARYVVKYLGKQDFAGRVRASLGYGDVEGLLPDVQPFPGHRGARPPAVLPEDEARVLQHHRALLDGAADDDASRLSAGDVLGVCETGRHLGAACSCTPDADRAPALRADDPDNPLGTYSGEDIPENSRARLSRRGWLVPMPRLAALVVAAADPDGKPQHDGDREHPPEGDELDDTGWVDPDTWVHPDEAEGRVTLDVPGCVNPTKRRRPSG